MKMKGILLLEKTLRCFIVIKLLMVVIKCDESTKRCFQFTSDWLYTPGHPGNTTLTLSTCTGENRVLLIKSATFMRPEEIGDNCFTSCCLPSGSTCTADVETNYPQVFRDIELKCNGKAACQVTVSPAPMDRTCGKSSVQQCDSHFRNEVVIPQMNSEESAEFMKYYDFWCWSRKVEITYDCVHPDQVPTQIVSLTTTPTTTSTSTESTTSSTTTLPTTTTTTTTEPTTTTSIPSTSTTTTSTTTTPTSTTASTTESTTKSSTEIPSSTTLPSTAIPETSSKPTTTTSTTTKEKTTFFFVEFDESINVKTNIDSDLQSDILPTIPPTTSTPLGEKHEDIINPDLNESKEKTSTVLAPPKNEIPVVLVEEPPVYINVDESDLKPTSPKKKGNNAKLIACVAGACVLALIAICAVTVVIHIMLRRHTAKMIRKSSLKQPKRDNAAIMQTMNTLRKGENSLRYGEGPSSNIPVTHDLITFDRNSRLGSLTHSQGRARSFNGCDMVDNTYYEADDVTKPTFPPPCHPDQKQIINDIILSNYTIKQPVQKPEPTTDHVYYELCEDAANQSGSHIYNDVPNPKTRDSEDYYESSDDYQSSKSSDNDCRKLQSCHVNMPKNNYSGDDEDYYESSDDDTKPKLSQVKNIVNNKPPKPRSVQPSKSSDYDYAYDHFEFEGRVRAK